MKKGDILVTGMTDPDFVPFMKMASAIVTDKGGITSHAAIVSRELNIPCVVGTENAQHNLKTGVEYTVDSRNGIIYEGIMAAGSCTSSKQRRRQNRSRSRIRTSYRNQDLHEPRHTRDDRAIQEPAIRRHRLDAHRIHHGKRNRPTPNAVRRKQ